MHLDLIRDPSRTFPAVQAPLGLRSLRVWFCKYRSLQSLAVFQNLEELVIAGVPDTSLDFLVGLRNLRYLSICHLPKILNLTPLESLLKVESLSLSTLPSWDASGKRLIVESLEPLTKMPALKHLELFGVCPENKSLAALAQCPNLQSVRLSHYPKKEIERYYASTRVKNQFNPPPLV